MISFVLISELTILVNRKWANIFSKIIFDLMAAKCSWDFHREWSQIFKEINTYLYTKLLCSKIGVYAQRRVHCDTIIMDLERLSYNASNNNLSMAEWLNMKKVHFKQIFTKLLRANLFYFKKRDFKDFVKNE